MNERKNGPRPAVIGTGTFRQEGTANLDGFIAETLSVMDNRKETVG